MKSIFAGDYSSNITRINRSGHPPAKIENGGGAADGDFSKVLSRLESSGAAPSSALQKEASNSSSAQKSGLIGRPLTKAETAIQTPVSPDLSALVTHFSINPSVDGPPLCPLPNWSKSTSVSAAGRVKTLAPESVAGTKGIRTKQQINTSADLKAPSTPVLRSASRYEGEHVVRSMAFGSDDIRNVIETAGKFHGIDPALGMAVATAESSLRPDAVSRDGFKSKGLFQLLDTTGKEMQTRMGINEKYDPFDPALNAHLGVGYLRYLHDLFSAKSDLGSNLHTVPVRSAEQLEKLAVAAFNAGEGNVAMAQARAQRAGKDPADYDAIKSYLPASTREYVMRVTSLRSEIDLGADSTDTV